MSAPITFQAIFNKATTLIDGGWRVSFDLLESEGSTVAQLATLKDDTLNVAVVPDSMILTGSSRDADGQ